MANRYDIITGNLPDIPEPESRIRTFGIDVDITDINVYKTSYMELFRGRRGESPRIAFVEDRKQMFVGAKVHWTGTGSGYIICKEADVNHVCCQRFGRSRWRMGSVIFRYDEGSLSPMGKVMPWVFSKRIYNMLHEADRNFPLDQYDYMVQCEDDRYQTLSFQPVPVVAGGSTHISPAVIAFYAENIKKCRQQVRVALGVDLSKEEIQNFPDNRSRVEVRDSSRQVGNRIPVLPQRGRATRALTDSAETFLNDLLEE